MWVDTNDNVLKKYNLSKNQWEIISGQITGDTLPIGAIMPYTSKTTPSNWLPCNGQAVSRTTYADLFAIIGTQYGAGDGSTTFNVPDLNDYKVPIGYDRFEEQSNRMNLGTTGGEEKHTLTVEEMPTHTHGTKMAVMYDIDKNYGFSKGGAYSDRAVGRYDNVNNYLAGNQNIQNTGGNQAHNNMQPYVTTNYIIKAFQSSGVVAQVSNTKSNSTTDTYSCDYINKRGTINQIIIDKYSTSWWQSSSKISEGAKYIVIDMRSDEETDNVTVMIPVGILKKYSTYGKPYFIKNNSNLIFQCIISPDNTFQGLNRAEAGSKYVANVYEVF